VEVLKLVSAVDSGTIINPASHLSQVEGGMVTGLGFALMEEMPVEEGRVTTLHLGDFKIPNVQDIPPHQTVYIASESGHTPYGGKAIGEITNSSVAPAIANAVADAIGVPITDLPISGERVYYALRKRQGS
jgi:CO/xanthine dehydrogenase Mo-binding subunit